VDDLSTDGSLELLRAMAQNDERIKLIVNTENRGANVCRNRGLQLARGRYLLFFDGDDVLAPTCLAARVAYMQANQTLDFSVFTLQVFEKTPGDRKDNWIPNSKHPLNDFLKHDLPWQTMQPIWRTSFLTRVGGFDESFQRLQDVEFHTRILLNEKPRFSQVVGDPDCFFRIDEQRINYDYFSFLLRWIDSAILFCEKFRRIAPKQKQNLFLGTIFQTYLTLLLYYKDQRLDEKSYMMLEEKLLDEANKFEIGFLKRKLFALVKYYNLLHFRIPGVNRILKKVILK
jgi:glycosyltransferase involved in cell wall biosynthesis